jgi:nucleoside 2-deoxyribosyltransferase
METKLPIQDFTPNSLRTYPVKTVAKTFFESKAPIQESLSAGHQLPSQPRYQRFGYTRESDDIAMKIYLAGPLFTAAERAFNRRLRDLLVQRGYEVWLPQEHEPRSRAARDIFLADVEGLDSSDVVVANMDGPDPDSGTCWECGYAYKKKPIIVYRTDFRKPGDTKTAPYNLMLTESADEVVDLSEDFDDEAKIVQALDNALAKIAGRPGG